ncbi:MAG: glycosyltransferase family 4 protein [Planctomycetia bacterium]|nr:glycosyltransferase family 4 protein [Planctomycetia bacterium]
MWSIGVTRRNYGAEKTVYGAVHPGLAFRRVGFLPLQRVSADPFWRHATVVAASSRVDLVHLFNDTPLACARPWVTTFEDRYPLGRDGRLRRLALRQAAGPRCRAVVAFTEDARRRLLADPVAGPVLAGKCEVVLPCVPREDDLYARHLAFLDAHPPGSGPLRFLFVGVKAFLKGLEFVLDAVEPAVAAGDATLTVVSALETDTYVSRADASRVTALRARLAATRGVVHHERLPARAVREAMADHHLLLFPTLDETFGYVLPEAFATGLDVVTTATRAIPEIVAPEDRARLVALPVDALGGWTGVRAWRTAGDAAWASAWADARERCVAGLRARLAEVRADPASLRRRAPALRARYEALFSPEALGARLAALYARVATRPLGRS